MAVESAPMPRGRGSSSIAPLPTRRSARTAAFRASPISTRPMTSRSPSTPCAGQRSRRTLADPVLLITGASSGIGAETARQAAEAGYRLVLGARSEDALTELASELGGDEHAIAVATDVTEWEDNQRLAKAALDSFGQIDAVFANAGFGATRGFLEGSPEQWRSMVLTNVLGVALTIRATLPHLLERNSGHFLITSSVAGRRALPGSLYSATKHAVTAIGEGL